MTTQRPLIARERQKRRIPMQSQKDTGRAFAKLRAARRLVREATEALGHTVHMLNKPLAAELEKAEKDLSRLMDIAERRERLE